MTHCNSHCQKPVTPKNNNNNNDDHHNESHLQTAVMATAGSAESRALRYLHKAQDGRCDPGDGYGIRTAEMCGLPWEIVEEARVLRTQ